MIITAMVTGRMATTDMSVPPSAGADARVSLLRLMAWMSPAFPLGGFAWSGGLERAVADGLVPDARALETWLALSLTRGALHNDAVLFAAAWRCHGDRVGLQEIADLAAALSPSAERLAETLSLGQAFLAAVSAWPHPVPQLRPSSAAFPVAVGSVAGLHGIAVDQALAAWLHSAVSQSVSAAIRLGVAGQREGVRVLAALEETISAVAEAGAGSTPDDLGSATIVADTASLMHETLGVRLFRS